MAFRITARLREYYRYTGVSADIARKGKGQLKEKIMLSNIDLARAYLEAIERGARGDSLAKFFTPDVIIREMPNRIAPQGSISNLARALAGAERGKQLFERQTFTISNILGEGNRVALEMDWTGITAVRWQNLPAGSELRDHVAVFLEFRDGRIARQQVYDCFEPW